MAKLNLKKKKSKAKEGLATDLSKVSPQLIEPVSTLEIANQYLIDGDRIFEKLIEREQDDQKVSLLSEAKSRISFVADVFAPD